MKPNYRKLFSIYFVVVALNTIVFVALYVWVPHLRSYLVTEDKLVEWLSALAYFGGFFVAFYQAFGRRMAHRWLCFIPWVSLLGFLDEISFGERLLPLSMPEVYEREIDSAHDFINLFHKIIVEHFSPTAIVIMYSTLLTVLMLLYLKYRGPIMKFLGRCPVLIFIFPFAILLSFGIVNDLGAFAYDGRQRWLFLEELLELDAALTWFFACFALTLEESPDDSKRQDLRNRPD